MLAKFSQALLMKVLLKTVYFYNNSKISKKCNVIQFPRETENLENMT